jgi:hypothetical protein
MSQADDLNRVRLQQIAKLRDENAELREKIRDLANEVALLRQKPERLACTPPRLPRVRSEGNVPLNGSSEMACKMCGHKMKCLACSPLVFWCPRCGTANVKGSHSEARWVVPNKKQPPPTPRVRSET